MKVIEQPKIKVGILTAALDETFLQAPQQCQLRLIRNMLATNDGRFEFSFIHFQKNNHLDIYNRGRDIIIPRNTFLLGRYARDLDIIHVNSIIYGRPSFYFLPMKKVITMHGGGGFMLPREYFSRSAYIRKLILWCYTKLGFLARIDRFVAVSRAAATTIEENLDVKPEHISVVYNDIDACMRPIAAAESVVRAKYGITQPFLLNVNNYALKKNLGSLVDAFMLLQDAGRAHGHLLVLVGKGIRESEEISSRMRDGKLPGVVFLDYVPQEDLPALYSAATALVNPTFQESFGLSNIEAMACGCPVISSRVHAVPEIVGAAALFIEDPSNIGSLRDAVECIIKDHALRADLIQRGYRQAEKYRHAADEMLKIYEDVVSTDKSS